MTVPRLIALLAAPALVLTAAGGCAGGGASDDGGTARGAHSPPPSPRPGAWIPGHVADMSVKEKVGQLLVPDFSSEGQAKRLIERYHVGGLIYFPRNLDGARDTAELSNSLQKAAGLPLLIGIDEEQGLVSRARFLTDFPGNMALGATRRPGDARAAARVTGTELRAAGVNQDYAPVADVNSDPDNPVIGVRSFGSDPALVSQMVRAAIGGYQSGGVAATAKHFPGHGDTATDSHTGLPVIKKSRAAWERTDAPPFKAAIAAGVDAIMSAHIVVPALDDSGDPATLSKKVLTGLLRQRLGFQGVIVTDSLRMAGVRQKYGDAEIAVRAVQAGADQLLMPPDPGQAFKALLRAVKKGTISRDRLDASVSRILLMKEKRGLFRGPRVDAAKAPDAMRTDGHRATARAVAEHAVTLVTNKDGVLPLRRGTKVHVTGPRDAMLSKALRQAGMDPVGSPAASDVAVLTTDGAGSGTAGRVRALRPKPVVVAALGAPYALDAADRAAATVATYSDRGVAVEALARVLAGTLRPTGRLPVEAGGKPVGHGLTYGSPAP